MFLRVKTCGLSTEETVSAAIETGARYVGFVFFPPSPRNVSTTQAKMLAHKIIGDVQKVGVFVNPSDALLSDVLCEVDLDIIQLHGNETVERASYIRSHFSKLVMKAVPVSSKDDIKAAREYEKVVDMLLFDAKPPQNMEGALPGGNGLAFDWSLIAGEKWHVPWMLSGGLDATNVAEAIKISGARIVDVSSGLEKSPGNKDIDMIKEFIKAAQSTTK